MRTIESFKRPVKTDPANIPQTEGRRLSLEQKILRMIRRYRAAEKRRERRQAAAAEGTSGDGRCRRAQPKRRSAYKRSHPFEKAARICKANTLARTASAAMAPMALGFVAGRLLSTYPPLSADQP